ncbi:hypothetical protein SLG_33150 [Sphingobium sp. SYK-6]|uniref:phage tail assembly chaperone n=1 Tax=Sphingobium sp. (strain NBRC 103272 / SYK-6) TaxID=627192 RepID=UPI0002276FBD|nr:phage tail assembly chaperone [Sphingobium sp. SYK-6]BAK67990.1 hypothetical protein SLG_33150 [Sphingobium sp. SYK-6]
MSFAQAARRLAGQAGLLLGWRPNEFWRATPDELADAFAALRAIGDASGVGGAGHPLDRASLGQLMEAHPDE